jgi:hypothetical protein
MQGSAPGPELPDAPAATRQSLRLVPITTPVSMVSVMTIPAEVQVNAGAAIIISAAANAVAIPLVAVTVPAAAMIAVHLFDGRLGRGCLRS